MALPAIPAIGGAAAKLAGGTALFAGGRAALSRVGSGAITSRIGAFVRNNPLTSGLTAGLALDDLPIIGGWFGGGGGGDDSDSTTTLAIIAGLGLALGAAVALLAGDD